jgi:hypothetical protein
MTAYEAWSSMQTVGASQQASRQDGEYIDFTVRVRMKSRWVPHFLGLLRTMQRLGSQGSSRNLSIFSDGDGDFRPWFRWSEELPSPAEPVSQDRDGFVFDAG